MQGIWQKDFFKFLKIFTIQKSEEDIFVFVFTITVQEEVKNISKEIIRDI